ncbi:RHS repeat-associated core domain-containing protein [Vibrio parahaemolyticus]|uniref:RHS repeat-associated core domain-containing protein n=2 Tax=Vibrio parahaemolyticus TaxID=670 RepID=UPI00038E134C|nr:RHS repeat-associated core domain-containing protein [Vibrio parahaemolyticus]EQL86401.1 RHS repeat-associated core domain protein [Vibrio parahaemolyticus VP2007-095]
MSRLSMLFLSVFAFSIQAVEVGTLPGDVVVQSGSAQYQLPISAPKGRGGNTPQVSLVYSSGGAPSGIIGSGFSLTGMPTISRCGSQQTIDSQIRAVQYDELDNFCLDGSRLIVTEGANAKKGSVYLPYMEDYTKVVLRKDASSSDSSFTAYTKAGDILTFGKKLDNATWLLTRVDDRTGKNPIHYNYNTIGQIQNIVYDIFSIVFVYTEADKVQSRDTTQTYFNKVNDVVRKGNKQLSKIEIKANNQLKNYYELRRRGVYQDDNSSTLAQQVLGISYCDSEGRCLPETTFEWYRNDPEKFQFEKTINNWGGATDGESEWFFDVNADQKQDYCRPQYSSTVFVKKLMCQFDVASKNSSDVVYTLHPVLFMDKWKQWIDFNGNGVPSLCGLFEDKIHCSEFLPSGDIEKYSIPITNSGMGKDWTWAFDFTGNGRPDFCRRGTKNELICSENNGLETFTNTHTITDITWGKSEETWWADIDGNGFQDLCSVTKTGKDAELTCTRFNAGKVIAKNQKLALNDLGFSDRRWWVDVNGDGAEDFCRATGKTSGNGSNLTCSLGSLGQITKFDNDINLEGDIDGDWNGNWGVNNRRWWLDINQDGRSDYCRMSESSKAIRCTNIFAENNLSFFSGSDTTNHRFWVVDFNQDGYLDYCRQVGSASGSGSSLQCDNLNLRSTAQPKLKSVTNGLGFKSSVEYARHQDVGTTTWPAKLAYPYAPSNPNALVVSKLSADDGVGGKVHTLFRYGPGRFHLQGEGHSGFAWIKQAQFGADDLHIKGREVIYRTDFPYSQSVSEAKEFILPTLSTNGLNWNFSESGILLNYSKTEYAHKNSGKSGQIIRVEAAQGGAYLPNNEFGYYEQYSYQGKTYLKVPDTFVPIAGEILVPIFLPSNDVYVLEDKSSSEVIDGSYTIYDAKLVKLSQSQVAHILPHLSHSSSKWYVNDSNHDGSLDLANHAQLSKKRLTVYQTKETSSSYDLNSRLLSTVETTQGRLDEYGNVGLLEVKTTAKNPVTQKEETFTQRTESIYSNNPTSWILGRLSQSTVSHIAPNGDQEKRTSKFGYDTSTGYLMKEIIEPGDKLSVTKNYALNSEGEVETTSISAWAGDKKGTETRSGSSVINYNGLNVEVVSTNAKGFVTRSNTNRLTGSTTAFDINGLESRVFVDGFGRTVQTRTKSQNGFNDTYTKYYPTSDAQCRASGTVPSQAVYCIVTQTDGLGTSIIYLDVLEREVRKASLGLNNKWVIKDSFYNSKGQLYKVTRPYFAGETPQYSITHYDKLGRVQSISEPGPAGEKPSWIRFSYGPLTVTETDALARSKTTYSNAMGWEIKVAQPEGATVEKTYSPIGKLLTATGADGATIVNRYDKLGNKFYTDDPDLGNWTYKHNGFGELISQTDAKGQTTTMDYDVLGRMTSRTTQTITEVSGKKKTEVETSSWIYDTYGKHSWKGALLRETKPGYTKNLTYTSLGQVDTEQVITASHTFSRSFEYNNLGQLEKEIRPNQFSLHYDYDSKTGVNTGVWGDKSQVKLTFSDAEYRQVIQPLINEAMSKSRSYLSKANELIKQVRVYEARVTEYEILRDKIQHVAGGTSEIYEHVYGKALDVFVAANGAQYLQVPDNFVLIAQDIAIPLYAPPAFHLKLEGNSISKVSLDEWRAIESSLTPSNTTVFYGDFDGSGQAGITEVPVGRDHPLYDSEIRLQFNRLHNLAAEIQRLEYVRNDLHQKASNYVSAAQQLVSLAKQTELIATRYQTMSADSKLESEALEGLESEHLNKGRIYYWTLNGLDAEGRVRAELYGNGLANLYDYHEGTGQLLNITTQDGTKSIRALHYVYDRMDNVKRRTDLINNIDEYYDYDNLDRLESNVLNGLNGKHRQNAQFYKTYSVSYNRAGNIDYKSDVGHYKYDDLDHVHAVTKAGNKQYTYDANGNMLSGDNRSFTWTGFNKPSKITRGSQWVSFSYDNNRQRYFKQNQDSDKTWYLGKAYERIERANGEVEHKQFISGGGKLVAVNIDRKKSNASGQTASFDRQVRYLHSDALGSNDLITDLWGNVVERKNYDAWGKERYFEWEKEANYLEQDPMVNRGYTGHEQVEEIGLIHMNARMYDATLGRFISADSFIQAPSNSQSFNRYSYVQNNPMKYTDPSGHFFKKIFKEIKRAFKNVGKFIKKNWRMLAAVAIAVVAPYAAAIVFEVTAIASLTAGQLVVTGFVAGAVSGAITGRSFKSALIGGMSGAMFATLHNFIPSGAYEAAGKMVAHGMAGGMSSVMQGGSFGDGFISAAVMQGISLSPLGGAMDALSSVEFNNQIYNAAMSAAIGGTVSVLTGGKFKNGAVSAAFSRMLNDGIEGFSENVGVNRYSKVYWKRMHDEKTNMPIQEIRMVKAKWNPIWGLNDLLEAAVGKRMVIDYQYLTKDYYIYEKYDEFKYYETYSVSDSTLLHVSEAIPTGKVKWINTGILHHRSVADIRACPVNCDVSDLRGVLGKDD